MVKFCGPRKTSHSAIRGTARRTSRTPVRSRWRAPDDLGTALTCYRRALRSHKRLAKLAPAFFDSAVINREARRRKAQRDWMASWEPALNKVYGSAPKPPEPTVELPPLPSVRTQEAVDRELASFWLWFDLGHTAFERYKARGPHELISLTRIVQLIEIGSGLARMAAGMDGQTENESFDHSKFEADLERVYGKSAEALRSTEEPAAQPVTEPKNLPCTEQLQPTAPPAVPGSQPSLPASPQQTSGTAAYHRRDAWASYSRYLREGRAVTGHQLRC